MAKVEVYSSLFCPYCRAADRLLSGKGVECIVYDVDADGARRREMVERSGRTSVPQIFIDDQHIGGFDDLADLDAEDGLDPLLGRG